MSSKRTRPLKQSPQQVSRHRSSKRQRSAVILDLGEGASSSQIPPATSSSASSSSAGLSLSSSSESSSSSSLSSSPCSASSPSTSSGSSLLPASYRELELIYQGVLTAWIFCRKQRIPTVFSKLRLFVRSLTRRELRLIHLSRIIAVDGSALDISLKNFADGEVTVDRRVKTTEELLLELPAVSRFQATDFVSEQSTTQIRHDDHARLLKEKFSRSLRKLAKKEAKRLSCETDITLAAAHELLRSACPPLPTVTLPLPLSRDELAEDGFVTHDEAMDAQAYSRDDSSRIHVMTVQQQQPPQNEEVSSTVVDVTSSNVIKALSLSSCNSPLDCSEMVDHIKNLPRYRDQIVSITAREPREKVVHQQESFELHPSVMKCLRSKGITQLYCHQADALEAILERGESVVVTTPTSSGKSLIYIVPYLEAYVTSLEEGRADEEMPRALFLFPTKALTQDQQRSIREYVGPLAKPPVVFTYDGDTAHADRNARRKHAHMILTNPDMLHHNILREHTKWASFFGALEIIVVDEAHLYTGSFGSNVSGALRRLVRLVEMHGGSPQWVLSSATMANPVQHAFRLTSLRLRLINNDGAPQGRKSIVIWRPPLLPSAQPGHAERESVLLEGARLIAELMRHQIRTLCFSPSRLTAELLLRYTRHVLKDSGGAHLVNMIDGYRGGYRKSDRRVIERRLFDGDLLAVSSTNALELGIDVGTLDVVVMCGFPGSRVSMVQQSGRAGRVTRESLCFFIPYEDPLSQILIRDPEDMFDASKERVGLNPWNSKILTRHLACAAKEAHLRASDHRLWTDGAADYAGEYQRAVIAAVEKRFLEKKDHSAIAGGTPQDASTKTDDILVEYQYCGIDDPYSFSIRDISESQFRVFNACDNELVESGEEWDMHLRAFPGSVYVYRGEKYMVTDFDVKNKKIIIEPIVVDFFTKAVDVTQLRILRDIRGRSLFPTMYSADEVPRNRVTETTLAGFKIAYGEVEVRKRVTRYLKFLDGASHYYESVDMRDKMLPGIWWEIPKEAILQLDGYNPEHRDHDPRDIGFRNLHWAAHAVEHLCLSLLPSMIRCHHSDMLGPGCDAASLDRDNARISLYDTTPGGSGHSEQVFECVEELWERALDVVSQCPCEHGCNTCIFLSGCAEYNAALCKRGAIVLLQFLSATTREPAATTADH